MGSLKNSSVRAEGRRSQDQKLYHTGIWTFARGGYILINTHTQTHEALREIIGALVTSILAYQQLQYHLLYRDEAVI